ncbi:Shugoshin C terminus [Striga hermonthica]|uniref:Shugoshin C terminus n=1 Tax=Striga hermonthica TaxID=68872 RepID=A0A9N7MKI8_STRHE|nr:Shugoshin C terminus [Striga hermonthica]
MKGGKMARRSSFGNMVRKRLSDITNFQPPQTKSSSFPENPVADFASAKDYIDHLVKEKMALVKLIQDKNKIIELSGNEIQHLRACVQKMQLQNWSLAQSNSHMLAELNMGRERMKALHHEVACKEALLKTKNSSSKGKVEMNIRRTEFQESEAVNEESMDNEDTKCCNAGMRRHISTSRSLGSLKKSNHHAEKEAALSKRRCVRRQSGFSRIRHEERMEHFSEIIDARFPVTAPVTSDTETEVEARRSFARPMRKAAGKVQSYKERPINVKMRRSE